MINSATYKIFTKQEAAVGFVYNLKFRFTPFFYLHFNVISPDPIPKEGKITDFEILENKPKNNGNLIGVKFKIEKSELQGFIQSDISSYDLHENLMTYA